jgi:hypothetical protein
MNEARPLDREAAAALIEPLTEIVIRAGAAILAVNDNVENRIVEAGAYGVPRVSVPSCDVSGICLSCTVKAASHHKTVQCRHDRAHKPEKIAPRNRQPISERVPRLAVPHGNASRFRAANGGKG